MERKINTKRWTEEDEDIYFCTACESWHYITSKIGKKHLKFKK